jgi:nucleoside-diphosphate-sugar epimerase
MEASRQAGVERVVHTSTSETYGTALYTPINEAHPLQAQSPYSASKIGADKVVESYYRTFELPVTTIRPFNTYGPRQSARAVIPTIISQAFTQSEIHLGSLDPVRDITYVIDTVYGFIKGAETEATIGETINIGTGTGLTIGEIASKVLSLIGSKKQIITDEQRVRPENSEVLELICDNTKAQLKLGWSPQYTLEDGLLATIEFIKDHIHEFKPSQYNV